MKYLQRSGEGSQLLLLVLSLVGAGISIYLTLVHYENVPLVCSQNGLIDCARVLSSSYSVVPGTTLPVTVPGLGWCIVSASLAIAGLFATAGSGQRRIRIAQFIWALLGLLVALYLVYVEIVRLHTICAWCTAFHVLILLLFLVTLVQLQSLPSVTALSSETGLEETENISSLPRSK